MKKLYFLSVVLLILLLSACNNSKIDQADSKSVNNEIITYEQFLEKVEIFKNNFEPVNFINISDKDINIKSISTFPPDIKLDNRKNDGVDGDPERPSKYFFYYLNNDETVLIKVNLIYAQTLERGIILNSIVSPADNVGLSESYQKISRPYAITKLLSAGDYLISLEYYLIDSNNVTSNIDDTIMDLIKVDIDFYKQLEDFLLNNL